MPNVTGKKLDVAQSDVKRAGFEDDVEIIGGGLFGVLSESNWEVCEQTPLPGKPMTVAPRLKVDRDCTKDTGNTSTASPEPKVSPSDKGQPEAKAKPAGDGTNFEFGQTAHFQSTAGSNDIPLEFTVSAPETFTPSKGADVSDALASGGPQLGNLYATNVFFTITIKNSSATQAWEPDFLFGHVHQTGDDEKISGVRDGSIDSTFSLDDIPPGKTATFKDGFSVMSADNIQYELDVDGLAGKSFYWTK
jgi:hypothetical protein